MSDTTTKQSVWGAWIYSRSVTLLYIQLVFEEKLMVVSLYDVCVCVCVCVCVYVCVCVCVCACVCVHVGAK